MWRLGFVRILFILFLSVATLYSCAETGSNSNNSVEDNNRVGSIFAFDSSLSLSCNICLIKDSIDQIRMTRVFAEMYEEPFGSSLILLQDELNDILDDWKREFGKKNKGVFGIERTATEFCKEEYASSYKLDSLERSRYLLKYVTYAHHSGVGEKRSDIDTSEFKTPDGYYEIKFQGNTVRVKNSEFPEYWENGVAAHKNARNYIESVQNDCIEKISGKQVSELSKIEMLMFLEQTKSVDVRSTGYTDSLLNDQRFQGLYQAWEKTWLNK